jgi:hypothetical protein
MQRLTDAAQHTLEGLAQRYGVSLDAVTTLLHAVSLGGGSMAQFYHPELGGGGQWMQGGMTMVGDMFNGRLQSTVSGLCSELSELLRSQPVFVPAPVQSASFGSSSSSAGWWPAELGQPSSSGGQNDVRYAYFPAARRLAVSRGGQVSVYDTLDHQIGGVQQQQGGAYGSQSFTSQFGTFTVDSLPLASSSVPASARPLSEPNYAAAAAPPAYEPPAPASYPPSMGSPEPSPRDVLGEIERLGQLYQRGILTDDEFRSKKAELLGRL